MKHLLPAIALSALAFATPATAATLFLSDNPTNPTQVSNPNLQVNYGSTNSLYVWAMLGPISTGLSEKINGIGVDILSTNPATLTGLTPADNSYITPTSVGGFTRWNTIPTTAIGGDLLTNVRLIAVTTDGLDADRTPDALGPQGQRFYKVFSISYKADQLGSTNLFFRTNPLVISFDTNRGTSDNHFGASDASVNFSQNGGGIQSTLADATITVVPLPLPSIPAAFALLAIPTALRRRRQP